MRACVHARRCAISSATGFEAKRPELQQVRREDGLRAAQSRSRARRLLENRPPRGSQETGTYAQAQCRNCAAHAAQSRCEPMSSAFFERRREQRRQSWPEPFGAEAVHQSGQDDREGAAYRMAHRERHSPPRHEEVHLRVSGRCTQSYYPLQRVLRPDDPDRYYSSRELMPSDMLDELNKASQIIITNCRAFKRREWMAEPVVAPPQRPSKPSISRPCGPTGMHSSSRSADGRHHDTPWGGRV